MSSGQFLDLLAGRLGEQAFLLRVGPKVGNRSLSRSSEFHDITCSHFKFLCCREFVVGSLGADRNFQIQAGAFRRAFSYSADDCRGLFLRPRASGVEDRMS